MIENIPVYSYYICKNGSRFPSLQGGCDEHVHKHEAYLSEPIAVLVSSYWVVTSRSGKPCISHLLTTRTLCAIRARFEFFKEKR